ncbi:MAG: hypothetical protein L0Y70_20355, partial [Gemmataceae bacterium]|nr:hypothetical protein [Gemmataceae bacterium]
HEFGYKRIMQQENDGGQTAKLFRYSCDGGRVAPVVMNYPKRLSPARVSGECHSDRRNRLARSRAGMRLAAAFGAVVLHPVCARNSQPGICNHHLALAGIHRWVLVLVFCKWWMVTGEW